MNNSHSLSRHSTSPPTRLKTFGSKLVIKLKKKKTPRSPGKRGSARTQGLVLWLFGTNETRGEERGLQAASRPLFLSALNVDPWPRPLLPPQQTPPGRGRARRPHVPSWGAGAPTRDGRRWVSGPPGGRAGCRSRRRSLHGIAATRCQAPPAGPSARLSHFLAGTAREGFDVFCRCRYCVSEKSGKASALWVY